MNQQCWQILGIEPTDDQQAIRSAYRSKLPDYHPEIDPDGFQLLRQAFENARKLAESPFILHSTHHAASNGTQDDYQNAVVDIQREEQSESLLSATHQEQLFENMLAEFDSLLNTPETRYQAQSWHRYIYQLGQHDIELIDRLRWPLLERVYNASCVSTDCVRLLAERFNWRQRLQELEQDDAARLDDYLDYIARADIFDLSTLSSISLPAQIETVAYFRYAYHLYWNEPIWVLRSLLTDQAVLYWPNCPRLMKQLANWYSLAEVPSEILRDYCLEQLALDTEDRDWLYLTARHCALLHDEQRAFDYWLRLYQLEGHAQAEQWLLNWCREKYPAYLPLLIQSFDRPVYPAVEGGLADDEMQSYLTPTQTVQTFVRWGEAAQLSWDSLPIARAYINWKSGGYKAGVMYEHLVLDDGSDPLRLLYRHASMLTLGNEGLLQQIIDQPTLADPLQALILQGLQSQAAQRLVWLSNSSAITSFTQWLDGPTDHELPELFTDTDSVFRQQVIIWLQQWRYMSPARLNRLYYVPELYSELETIKHWLSYLAVEDQIEIPVFDDATATWDQYRQTCLLALLLNGKVEQIDIACQINNLTPSEQHPVYDLYQLIRQLDPSQGNLAWQFEQQLQLDNRLHYLCWGHLPISISQFLQRVQSHVEQCDVANVDFFYRNAANWRDEILQASLTEQRWFYTFLLHNGYEESYAAIRLELDRVMKELELQQPLSEDSDTGNYRLLQQATLCLNKAPHAILDEKIHQQLMARFADTSLPNISRLNAGLLAQLSNQRGIELQRIQEQMPDSRFWQFWQFNRRIDRMGLLAQLTLVPIAMFLVYILLKSVLSAWVLIGFILINTYSALLRRGHDLDRRYPAIEAGVLMCMPYLIPLYLLIPGVKHRNKHGRPPGEKG
ncbi:hypothetical protein [Serratia aquatilis]|uniref:J domain-containing protein n=1 Tax=Serratia aquatilis TaxID=1737515 RepID=A0ABV6ED11_9GAMM